MSMARTRSPQQQQRGSGSKSRSLARGIEILRSFRPGIDLLGNAEIAERTGLSKATISRLTQTLAAGGLLDRDAARRAYRLAAPVLSLALAMQLGSPVLQIARPLMRAVAEKRRVNVGLAVPDRDAMVYLESVRSHRKASLRQVVPGQRIPIELTSLGRAYLSTLDDVERKRALGNLKPQRRTGWAAIEREVDVAVVSVRRNGYCWAAWQPGVVAVAAPIELENGAVLGLNLSVTSDAPAAGVARELKEPLLDLKARLSMALREA